MFDIFTTGRIVEFREEMLRKSNDEVLSVLKTSVIEVSRRVIL
jgi:hypothetical protein